MPAYDYRCPCCGVTKEVRHGRDESPDVYCRHGRERVPMRRQLSVPAISFRGPGFYSTDSRRES